MDQKKTKYLYWKLFKTYTIVIIMIVLVLEIFFISSIKNQVKQTNQQYNQMLCNDAGSYIKDLEEVSSTIQYNLYKSEEELIDIIWYLENDINTYLEMHLNAYTQSISGVYYGMKNFVLNTMDLNSYLSNITFISYASKIVTVFTKSDAQSFTYSGDVTELIEKKVIINHDTITFVKDIRNPKNTENVGAMFLTYSIEGLYKICETYKNQDLLVVNQEKQVLYQSNEDIQIEQLFRGNEVLTTNTIERITNKYISQCQVNELHVFAYMQKKRAKDISFLVWVSLIAIGVLLFFIGELFVHFRLIHFSRRLETLLTGMERVKKGNLKIQLEIEKEKSKDELDIIGEYFNQMCKDLDTYIQRSYLAEIEQKNAEMSALQSQINPHFLYNTLESIRMKAICNGDREVGKMLYGLAVIFRSQIKEENVITIAKELHYCKKYLELFEFRYQNKFHFILECKEEWMEYAVIKFIVQPIIENYFVHGIRLKDDDNLLRILVQEEEKTMVILVEDNGMGMTQDKIKLKNEELQRDSIQTNSIGIINVQRRIQAAYGKGYGIYLEAREERGLRVILRFPKEKKQPD